MNTISSFIVPLLAGTPSRAAIYSHSTRPLPRLRRFDFAFRGLPKQHYAEEREFTRLASFSLR